MRGQGWVSLMQHVTVSHATTLEHNQGGQLEERLNTHLNFVYYYSSHLMDKPRDHGHTVEMPDGVT